MNADEAPPPAIYFVIPAPAKAPAIEYGRALRVILMLEGHSWDWPGGALAFQPTSWKEETRLPFSEASDPQSAIDVAKTRLRRFAIIAEKRGVKWTPHVLFDSWRWGIDEACANAKAKKHSDYALRGGNLYEDKSFR